jgi:DNA helicase-2/ATP-dependent DNA helicase PcrA
MLDPMAVPKKPTPPRVFVPDEKQREAIEHVDGPMLVIAGAGTGKTSVLVNRIARLIREGHARPDEILALTYTDNAAAEMRQRVKAELKDWDVSKLQAVTFHAYCNGLLHRTGNQFNILDDKDLWIFLRRRIRDLHLQHFIRAANVGQFLNDLLDFIRRCQDELVTPEKYQEYMDRLCRRELHLPRVARSKDALPEEEALDRCREIARVFTTAENWLAERNLGTFGHMITKAHDLLYSKPDLLQDERNRIRFVLVDEFQDANCAQIRILSALAGEARNVFAVGDPDQAIYRFRGASSAAFALFHRMFPATRLVVLDKNRRSRTPILKCAFSVISKNAGVFAGEAEKLVYKRSPLVSVRDEEMAASGAAPTRTPVQLVTWNERELEAADLINELRNKRRQLRCPWSSFAVLYRSHSNRDNLVEELVQNSIPFIIENMDVLDTSEVRDLLACLGAVVSLADSASLFRVAAMPRFKINGSELRAAMKAGGRDAMLLGVLPQVENGSTVLETIRAAKESIERFKPKVRAALETVARHFEIATTPPSVQALLDFASLWEKKAITETGEPSEFLDYLEHFAEAGGSVPLAAHDDDSVRLMTAHAAKGLEFDHVFILRAYKPSFPSSYREPLVAFPRELRSPDSLSEDDGSALSEQEERRLFYVAMTRARESLTIYAKNGKGMKDPTPPGFVRELLGDASSNAWRQSRPARPLQVDLFAEEEAIVLPTSNASVWFSMQPQEKLIAQLSASAIEIYERCPLRFKLERDWRIPREIPAALHYGTAMHRALLAYYDAVRFRRKISDEAVIDVFRAILADAAIQDRYQHDLYQRQGIEQLRAFLESARRAPSPQVLETEASFTIEIGDATIRGRIDRMDRLQDDSVAIIDYKTGKPRSQKDADESLQLSIYALAVQEKWNATIGRVAFHNLEDNSRIDTTRTQFDLEGARTKVEDVTKDIREGRFPAKPGFQCGSCPYRNLCPATEKNFSQLKTASAAGARNN